jgi:enoyl-CoA hydratase/carnithine racemase
VSEEFVHVEQRGRVLLITLDRPEKMNALNGSMMAALAESWQRLRDDDELLAAIVTGAGDRAFSAGNDLKYTAAHAGQTVATSDAAPMGTGGFGGITSRYDLFKPVIAAVNGWAMGGGCEIALACDIIVAAEHARFALPEPRVGLVAGAGGMHRLPRQLPLKIAMGMMLTAKPIEARQALHYGLANEVVPQAQLMATAERWANEILECAPLAARGSKQAAMTGLELPLADAIRGPYSIIQAHMRSNDRLEGPRAFAEKRPPVWQGE